MRKILFVTTILLSLYGCKKDSDTSSDTDNGFIKLTLSEPNAYLNQPVTFGIENGTGAVYNIDFGDGATTTSKEFLIAHTYIQAGTYTITAKLGKSTSVKRLRIFPGNASFTVTNGFSKAIQTGSVQVFDPLNNPLSTLTRLNLLVEQKTTDTVFVNIPETVVRNKTEIRLNWKNVNATDISFSITGSDIVKGIHNKICFTGTTNGNYSYIRSNNVFSGFSSMNSADNY
jgi:hypothetical protein